MGLSYIQGYALGLGKITDGNKDTTSFFNTLRLICVEKFNFSPSQCFPSPVISHRFPKKGIVMFTPLLSGASLLESC